MMLPNVESDHNSFQIVVLILARNAARRVDFNDRRFPRMIHELVERFVSELRPARRTHLHFELASHPFQLRVRRIEQRKHIKLLVRTFQAHAGIRLVKTKLRTLGLHVDVTITQMAFGIGCVHGSHNHLNSDTRSTKRTSVPRKA